MNLARSPPIVAKPQLLNVPLANPNPSTPLNPGKCKEQRTGGGDETAERSPLSFFCFPTNETICVIFYFEIF